MAFALYAHVRSNLGDGALSSQPPAFGFVSSSGNLYFQVQWENRDFAEDTRPFYELEGDQPIVEITPDPDAADLVGSVRTRHGMRFWVWRTWFEGAARKALLATQDGVFLVTDA
jgi:hypothetical protein